MVNKYALRPCDVVPTIWRPRWDMAPANPDNTVAPRHGTTPRYHQSVEFRGGGGDESVVVAVFVVVVVATAADSFRWFLPTTT